MEQDGSMSSLQSSVKNEKRRVEGEKAAYKMSSVRQCKKRDNFGNFLVVKYIAFRPFDPWANLTMNQKRNKDTNTDALNG